MVASLSLLVIPRLVYSEGPLLNRLSRYHHSRCHYLDRLHIRYTVISLLRTVRVLLLYRCFIAKRPPTSYAFLPQIVAWSILFGVSASNYDLSSPSMGDSRTVIGNR